MSMKILICDDEPHIRMLLEQTLEDLEDEDVELLVATNGQEGLDTILEERPNLVLLDVVMPKLSGLEGRARPVSFGISTSKKTRLDVMMSVV